MKYVKKRKAALSNWRHLGTSEKHFSFSNGKSEIYVYFWPEKNKWYVTTLAESFETGLEALEAAERYMAKH